jgi:hypothetical protein
MKILKGELQKMINFSNYAPQSVSDKGKTHEETFGFTRASLRSVAEYAFTGKSIRFAQSLRAINDFPKFSLRENFCKLHIQSNLNGGLPAGCNSTEARLI